MSVSSAVPLSIRRSALLLGLARVLPAPALVVQLATLSRLDFAGSMPPIVGPPVELPVLSTADSLTVSSVVAACTEDARDMALASACRQTCPRFCTAAIPLCVRIAVLRRHAHHGGISAPRIAERTEEQEGMPGDRRLNSVPISQQHWVSGTHRTVLSPPRATMVERLAAFTASFHSASTPTFCTCRNGEANAHCTCPPISIGHLA